jgi:hypothetical protein
MGVLAAVDSRGEWERGGGEVSWESSFTVRSGKRWAIQLYRSKRVGGLRPLGAALEDCAEGCSESGSSKVPVCWGIIYGSSSSKMLDARS